MRMKIQHLVSIIKNAKYHKIGKCNICGHYGIFLCTGEIEAARNSLVCLHCRSTSRNRHVASALLAIADGTHKTIKSLSKKEANIGIYNTNAFDCFYKQFHRMPNFTASLFHPDYEVGMEIKPKVFCQNLEKLTFENNSFDIVITEDVLEHIRHHENAFQEIYRVLKTGRKSYFYNTILF